MNFPLLRRYLLKAAVATPNPALQGDMIRLLQQVSPESAIQEQEDDEVAVPDLNRGLPSQNQKVKGVEDLMLRGAMPEIEKQNPETPEIFGKLDERQGIKLSMLQVMKRASQLGVKMSAYIKDTKVSQLPEKVRKDVARFVSNGVKDPVVIHYGMVVHELLDRVDTQNWETAWKSVSSEMGKLSKGDLAAARDEFFKKAKEKYILLVNDQIVDGHHFLAKAKFFKVTNSLNVIDLTPARFQS